MNLRTKLFQQIKSALAVPALILAAVITGQAATYTVTNLNDSGAGSLREAITQANASTEDDVIDFSVTGQITLGGSQLAIANNGKLTINGPGASSLTISGGGASRVFYMAINANAEISGLTITGGSGTGTAGPNGEGGGIYKQSGTLTLTNSTVSGNTASTSGGGIYQQDGTLTLTNTIVSNNTAAFFGGGIYLVTSATLTNSTVSNNSATNGGGIYISSANVNLTNTTVSNNSASSDGGGIYNASSATNLMNTTVSGNTSRSGGGIFSNDGTVNLTNTTVSNNSATNDGGGINNFGGTANLTNTTVSNNSASSRGGGIFQTIGAQALNLKNTIIANSASGGDCFSGGNTAFSASYSLVEDGSCGVVGGVDNNKTGDPNLGSLQNNGGATRTHALLPGSIAVNAGDNCVLTANGCGNNNPALTTDQRGAARVGQVDIGSFEAPATLVVTNTSDSGAGSLRDAVNAANADPFFDSIIFDIPQTDAGCVNGLCTIRLTSGQLNIAANSALNIQGPGVNRVAVSGNNQSRVFSVNGGANVALNGLTVTGGNVDGDAGGGGIRNNGILTVTNCTISGNFVNGSTGGGIANNFERHSDGDELDDQRAIRQDLDGGGIANNFGGTLTVTNSTISGNSSEFLGGGGIGTYGTVTLMNATISGNSASNSSGGGIGKFNSNATINAVNTIISGNTASSSLDLSGSLNTNTNNFIGGNALLAPLGFYGGTTMTHALLSNSPAINAGTSSGAPLTDQRGAARVGAVDIGAVEFQADTDGDKWDDLSDNCPSLPNPDQADVNNNGIGDACETRVLTDYNAQINKTVFNAGETFTVTLNNFADQFNNPYLPSGVQIQVFNADYTNTVNLPSQQSSYSHQETVPPPGDYTVKVTADNLDKTFSITVNAPPSLGNYQNAGISLAGNTTVAPDAAPMNAAYTTASTTADFKGELEADIATGVVRVTNAHPAGTYAVTVKAFGAGGATTKTFNLTVTTPAGCNSFGASAFAPAANFSTGSFPHSVAVGDINGDGRQDVATANISSNNVSVLLRNSANNGFEQKVDYPVGNRPNSIAVGDINGDGRQDIVVGNNNSNTVSVLFRNAANDGFDAPVALSTPALVLTVAIGDLNGDGLTDIAAGNNSNGIVSVFLRNADNTGFAARIDLSVSSSSLYSISIADFNGDGKSDIAAASISGAVSILYRNAANDGFDPAVTITLPSNNAISMTAGDFNDDGRQDFAVSYSGRNYISVYLRNAANDGFISEGTPAATGFYHTIAAGDFNNDGKQDIVYVASSTNSAGVLLRNAANDGFEPTVNFGVGAGPLSVAVGDFNGDNRQDIVSANGNGGGNNISILQRVCDSTPPVITPTVTGTSGSNDWYVSNVQVSWSVTDDESNVSSQTGCDMQTVTTDTNGVTFTCAAASAGGSDSQSVTIKRDATAPTINFVSRTAPNANGWNNTNVTVNWSCSDALSGATASSVNQTLSNEGNSLNATGICVDNAGNTVSDTQSGIKIDKTAPTLAPIVSPNPVLLGGSATASPNASDSLSGVASASCGAVNTSSVGFKTVACSAADLAGNTNSANAEYQVGYNFSNFFQPVANLPAINEVKAGQAIPVKFSLSGNFGLNIFAAGYPISSPITCDVGVPGGTIDETVTAGGSSLSYDAATDQYSYVWKTDKKWKNTCRLLVVKFNDGSQYSAKFRFK